jgi:hypothetical protein
MQNIQNKFDDKIERFISEISSITDVSTSVEIYRVLSNVMWSDMFMNMGDIQDAKYKR